MPPILPVLAPRNGDTNFGALQARRPYRRRFRRRWSGGTIERSRQMTEQQEYKQLTREELDALTGGELPERAAMSLVNANLFIPVNAAIALNFASDNSV